MIQKETVAAVAAVPSPASSALGQATRLPNGAIKGTVASPPLRVSPGPLLPSIVTGLQPALGV